MTDIGFKTWTPDGVEQLNSNIPNMRVVATGTAGANMTGAFVGIPDVWPESAMLLIRPQPGVNVGGIALGLSPIPGQCMFGYRSTGTFQWAVCSTVAPPIALGSGKAGLKIWSPDGKLIFSPQYKYPRIGQIVSIASPPYSQSSSSTIRSIGFKKLSKMPWIIAQDAAATFEADFGGYSYPPFVYAVSVNSAFDTLTVRMRFADNFEPSGFSSYNDVYAGRLMRFPLCDIPGI